MKIYVTHLLKFRRGNDRITLEIESPDSHSTLRPIESDMIDAMLALYPGYQLFEYRCKAVDPEEPPF